MDSCKTLVQKMESSIWATFQDSLFSIIGAFLYVASGSVAIDYWSHTSTIYNISMIDAGLALGSFCIITGE